MSLISIEFIAVVIMAIAYILIVTTQLYRKTSLKYFFSMYLGFVMGPVGFGIAIAPTLLVDLEKTYYVSNLFVIVSAAGFLLFYYGAFIQNRREWAKMAGKYGEDVIREYITMLKRVSLRAKLTGNFISLDKYAQEYRRTHKREHNRKVS